MNDFRPISPCNIIYKIISKVVANKLEKVLNKVIGWLWSIFVGSRHILSNYIVAHEILHAFKKKKKTKLLGLKLDIAKACDRIEWDFIKDALSSFGFHKDFVHIFIECISSVSFFYSFK